VRFVFIALVLALSAPVSGYSQSLSNPFESFKGGRELIYGIDNRRTHIKRQNTAIYGAYTGLSFGKKLRYKGTVSGTLFEVGEVVDANGVQRKNRLVFLSLGEEFDFYEIRRFSATTYMQMGLGKNFYREVDANGGVLESGSKFIIPIETGLHFNYALTSYLKVKTGFGWRFVLPYESYDLSGYYVKLGLGFDVRDFIEVRRSGQDIWKTFPGKGS